jgi:MFS superfamily sulfate permease-like transporter
VVVFKDLSWGVAIGSIVGTLFVLRKNFRNAIISVREEKNVLINLNKDIYFMNKSQIKEVLINLKESDEVLIDGTKAKFIDHDISNILLEFKKCEAKKY